MCGVWVALEAVTDTNGPLFYYPGSHRFAVYDNEQTMRTPKDMERPASQAVFHELWEALIASKQCEKKVFHPKPGQALIWTANLIHGGSDIADPQSTRWSQVTHYFFEGCAYYRPMASHLLNSEVAYVEPDNLLTRSPIRSSYGGEPLPADFVQLNQQRSTARAHSRGSTLPVDFDAALYLKLNPDVAIAGADPAHHYVTHGEVEGRAYK
jgi:Phytanoyl-CoA dioxygenase (PhyH)